MKKAIFLFTASVAAILFTGCTQIENMNRVKAAKVSPFIEKPELLVPQRPDFPFHYFYLKKDAGNYANVYVAPVNVKYLRDNANWAKIDQKIAKQMGSDIQLLANYTRDAFKKEFASAKGTKTLNVVNSPNLPKTLIVEVAIVTIVPTKAELNVLGTAANIFLPGIGVLAGQLAGGSVTIECMIKDAKTKEIIAMFSNTEKDQRAILNFAGMTWYTSAEHNISRQADYTARVFSGSDYTKIRRRLIKIVEF